jgi:hypothetical protein
MEADDQAKTKKAMSDQRETSSELLKDLRTGGGRCSFQGVGCDSKFNRGIREDVCSPGLVDQGRERYSGDRTRCVLCLNQANQPVQMQGV